MYQLTAKMYHTVTIGKEDVVRILEEEKAKLLGGSDRWIKDGYIYEEYKHHRWHEDKVREATEEEIKINDALRTVIEYLNK